MSAFRRFIMMAQVAVRSCFGSGHWIGYKPWVGYERWKGAK